jgi:hypothetical protein
MVEEPLPPPSAAESVEIPEDTPHFLNPEILGRTEPVIDDAGASALPLSQLQAEEPSAAGEILSSYDAEETVDASVPEHADSQGAPSAQTNPLFSQPPEKIESVLNAGMQFIGGLLEMATGRPIGLSVGNEPMVQVDRERGEITLKFRLS